MLLRVLLMFRGVPRMFPCVFLTCLVSVVLAENSNGDYGRDFNLFPDLPVGIIDTKNIVCRDQSRLYLEHLKNMSLWAYEIKDSTAKSVTGILRGSISQFGHFHECLSVQAPFETQYCLAAMSADVPEPNPTRDPKSLLYDPNESVLRKIYDKNEPSQQPENIVLMGWCIPAACTPKDLQTYMNSYLEKVDFHLKDHNVTYTSQVVENSCQKQEENRYLDHTDIAFCLVVAIIVGMVFFSSAYDAIWNDNVDKIKAKSPLHKLAVSFSIQHNFEKLPRADESNPALQVLYGMRVFCIMMIITDHRFGTYLSSGILNFDIVEEQYRSTFGNLFFHGDLFVDSFFILSGMLVTYCLLVQYDKKFINPGFILLMRYIRLTPLYAFVIFYYATLFDFSGSGPMWKTIITPEVQDCRDNWWTNLLYINNYVNADHMCMVHSWYLPCDLHYFIVALLICILIYKNKKIGLAILGLVTFLTVLVPFWIAFTHQRPAVLYFYPNFLRAPKIHTDFLLLYSKSHTRASPYFVGMLAGYLYYKMKGSEKFLKKGYSYLLFAISLLLMITSILTGIVFYDPYYKYNALESAAYSALHRMVWAVGSVGVLYVASYGHAKFIYNFLSWKPWVPLSKLVYGAYLVHMQFQLRAVASKPGAGIASYFDIITYALSDIVLAFGTAFVLHLTIEAPFRNVFNIILVPHKENNVSAKPEENVSVSPTTSDSHL